MKVTLPKMPCPSCQEVMPVTFKKPHHFAPTIFGDKCKSCEAVFLFRAVKEKNGDVMIQYSIQKAGKPRELTPLSNL